MSGAAARTSKAAVPNSLGYGSLVLGDRWNLLILREAFRGARRFSDWSDRLGVSDPVLAARLKDLTRIGLLERYAAPGTARRQEYRLTQPGKDMWQVFVAIWLWDRRWLGGGSPSPLPRAHLRHRECGFTTLPLLGCANCEARGVTLFETRVHRHPDYTYDQSNPPRPYRRTQQPTADGADLLSAVDLLGDRWSTAVLAAAFLGAHRFQDFTRSIPGIPPLMLTDRINRFVEHGVLVRRPVTAGKRRMEYHLTAKGTDFFAVYSCEIVWATRAFPDRDGPPLLIEHLPCGKPFEPSFVCNACNERLRRVQVRFELPEV